MTDWKEYRLGEIINLKRGYDLPTSKRIFGNTPIISSSGISGFHDEFKAKGPGVVTGRYGTIGEVFYEDGNYWPLNTTLYVQDFKGNFPKFIYYFLKTFDFQKYNDKSSVPGVNRNHLHEEIVSLPPLATQTAIAEILSSLDDKIELNNQINRELEALAQALFKQWFVDFEFPDAEGVPYKSSGGEMVESVLGEIPLGWRVGTLSDIINFNPTERIPAGKDASYIDMASLPTQGSWPEKPIPRAMGSGMKFRNGDTLFARITPCLQNGKTAHIQCLEENEIAWGSTEFIVLRPKAPWVKEFGYLIARNNDFRVYAEQHMTGTSGRQRVQSTDLAKYEIAYPADENLISAFGEIIQSFFSQIKANSEESQELVSLRDALLPKLISGEVQVSEL